ncbi:T9SS type A sorting domain-containing protein [candidate division KSB1 bacterium]|nr:T9SS type A sorting domain-containing protein [candidate division KSB1 bacterium]
MQKILFSALVLSVNLSTVAAHMERESVIIPRLRAPVEINAVWDKQPWSAIQAIELSHHMGDYPEHFPHVRVKIAYDMDALYVFFRVRDQYVLALTQDYQGSVYKDSCVEFFFTPHEDVSLGYFNLEMNCGGTALFNFQKQPRTDVIKVGRNDFDQITVAHTMPKIVNPEIQDSLTWMLEYRIPFSILRKYSATTIPEEGTKWRANFFKCADNSSHPHWLTWSPVEYDRPNFHLPDYFGDLVFGGPTNVDDAEDNVPDTYGLASYPNPFNDKTTITFILAESAAVDVEIYNLNGKKIATLVHDVYQAGVHSVKWDAAGCASGLYICHLRVGDHLQQLKIACIG